MRMGRKNMSSRDVGAKKAEIETYDNQDRSRPAYDELWDEKHHLALLRHGPEGAFERLLTEFTPADRTLVLGCGNGDLLSNLRTSHGVREVVGIDLSKERLTTAARRTKSPSVHVLRSDAECLPFEDGSFDAVVAHSVLHHLPNWNTDGLDEIVRTLSPSGTLLFYEPGRYNPPAAIRRKFFPSRIHTPDERPFDPKELHDELRRAFDTVEMTGHCIVSNLFPVVDHVSPVSIPRRVTTSVYDFERELLETFGNRPAWILTGWAGKSR